ncbi:MAG TPA: putative baseplate assembly protein, partial [Frankiaceae bacterium]|nr:putative baseplate assembly protein [Frankiaceae bacterium]
MTGQLRCRGGQRRRLVRSNPALNGLDYLEVSDDQRRLTVYLLDKAPEDITAGNLRITAVPGGRPVRVVQLDVCRTEDPERDDCLTVDVDRPGDFSCYRLQVVATDERGRPTGASRPDFDPRFCEIDFSFKAGCPSELDCRPVPGPSPPEVEPEIRYLAKDYASFRDLLLDRLALTVPGWRERHVPDLALTLVEVLAYVGDHLSYYQDAVATEAYLDTARLRTSVRRHARFVDYRMHEGCTARVWVVLDTDTDLTLTGDGLAFLTVVSAEPAPLPVVVTPADLERVVDEYVWFEPVVPGSVRVRAAHSQIRFYTWADSECCLPAGATAATLLDGLDDDGQTRRLALRPGDVLVLQEVVGPATGVPGDADPTHRHAVRLTDVRPDVDPLTGTPVLEVQWAGGDALPFPLCLSSIGPPPECARLDPVSVARGNVVLADAGRTVSDESAQVPTVSEPPSPCADDCPDPPAPVAGRFRPALTRAPLTFRAPYDPTGPASSALRQDPRAALPQLTVTSTGGPAGPATWIPRADLLHSGPDDRDLVVEADDDGIAHLRFGDDVFGRAPAAGEVFTPHYRVGNGPDGNIGADTLAHVVQPAWLDGAALRVGNPVPAAGGIAPEPVADVKAFAPVAFRRQRQRAVTPADYAELAQRELPDRVQQAAADLRWTGSWYEVRVAVDALGTAEAGPDVVEAVRRRLQRYRRIGHDLVVVPATTVGLDIELLVCVAAHHRRSDVTRALLDRFGNRRLPDGTLGMFHPDAVTFGVGVTVSSLVAAAVAVPGVDNVVVTRL